MPDYAILSGLRVVEIASFIAGPSCDLHLLQLGAEVIRIDLFSVASTFESGRARRRGSLYRDGRKKGKKSAAIDPSRPQGRELAAQINLFAWRRDLFPVHVIGRGRTHGNGPDGECRHRFAEHDRPLAGPLLGAHGDALYVALASLVVAGISPRSCGWPVRRDALTKIRTSRVNAGALLAFERDVYEENCFVSVV